MEASVDKYESADNPRSGPFFAVSHTVGDIVQWLLRFFTITEEDRSKAGIYFSGEERD